jgi:hypothetical protein
MLRTSMAVLVVGFLLVGGCASTNTLVKTEYATKDRKTDTYVGGVWDNETSGATEFTIIADYAGFVPSWKAARIEVPKGKNKTDIAKAVRDQWNDKHGYEIEVCKGGDSHIFLFPAQIVNSLLIIDKRLDVHGLSTLTWSGLPDGIRIKKYEGRDCSK